LVLIAMLAFGTWFVWARPDLAVVEVSSATAAAAWEANASSALLDASGYVVARRQATVSSRITGKLGEVLIEEGQHVAAGQVLARLEPADLNADLERARAQLAANEAAIRVSQALLDQAQPKYVRSQELHSQGYLSNESLEGARSSLASAQASLEQSREQRRAAAAAVEIALRGLDDTVVRAPFAGVVTVKAAQSGEIVSPISAGGGFTRTGICTIVDMDSLEVQVDVAESFINRVTTGMPVSVKLNAYSDVEIPAHVIAVIPTADRSKATVAVRIAFQGRDPRVLPEMGAKVVFLRAEATREKVAPGSVMVPVTAVERMNGSSGLVLVARDGRIERRRVQLGRVLQGSQVILAGVAPGDPVVVRFSQSLADGDRVRIKPETHS
jgi:RND family efflux transporter MFP subunit